MADEHTYFGVDGGEERRARPNTAGVAAIFIAGIVVVGLWSFQSKSPAKMPEQTAQQMSMKQQQDMIQEYVRQAMAAQHQVLQPQLPQLPQQPLTQPVAQVVKAKVPVARGDVLQNISDNLPVWAFLITCLVPVIEFIANRGDAAKSHYNPFLLCVYLFTMVFKNGGSAGTGDGSKWFWVGILLCFIATVMEALQVRADIGNALANIGVSIIVVLSIICQVG